MIFHFSFLLWLLPFWLEALASLRIAASQPLPFAFVVPWVFVLFMITLQAELEKDPFDIPHAETEIVGGYETEYTGRRLAFLKLAKDVQIVLGAAIAVELFLGGLMVQFFSVHPPFGVLCGSCLNF
jgi:NADH-quinone oxidoreductase subunit H